MPLSVWTNMYVISYKAESEYSTYYDLLLYTPYMVIVVMYIIIYYVGLMLTTQSLL